MSVWPLDPAQLARLGKLADEINGANAPPPFSLGEVDGHGMIAVPVPDAHAPVIIDSRTGAIGRELTQVKVTLHPGLLLSWAPAPLEGGVVLSLQGGPPNGVADKDGVAAFLTKRGLQGLIRDLQAIDAAIGGTA